MVVLASGLNRLARQQPRAKCFITNYSDHTYAAHMGFFQAINVDHGKKPGEALGGKNYLPLTAVSREDIQAEALHLGLGFNEGLENRAQRLAALLLQRSSGDDVDLLTFALREIMRNVFEHSGADYVRYVGQYWPSYREVEVAISDGGMGVTKSLSANPFVEINTDSDAVRASLLPGVSGKVYRGRVPLPNDEWAHSGYGLYMTSGLCRRGGRFVIASGDSALIARGDSHRFRTTDVVGTALGLRLNLGERSDFNQAMMELRQRGSTIARSIKGAVVTPSVASGLLKTAD